MSWKKKDGAPAVKRGTHEIDATGAVVGRLATEVARLLMGKHKRDYTPHIDAGDFVKIKNIAKIEFTGKKWEQKKHFHSSNRPGGIKAIPMDRLRQTNPGEILRHAVKYMLPKNRTQAVRMKRLTIVK
jgi:large subunit ribosomal protein L13